MNRSVSNCPDCGKLPCRLCFAKWLTLRSRIFLSAGVQLLLCLVCCTVGFYGQYRLTKLFAAHEEIGKVAEAVQEIDKNVHQLKLAAENYLHTGATSKKKAAEKLAVTISQSTERLRQGTIREDVRELLDQMSEHVAEFAKQLERASVERKIREQLVHEVLPEKIDTLRDTIDRYAKRSDADRDDGFDSAAAFASLYQSESYLHRYLIRPRSRLKREFVGSVNTLVSMFNSAGPDETEATGMARGELNGLATEFRRLGLRSMQATLGFMFYENVVMAGQISEFSYYSKLIHQRVADDLQSNRDRRDEAFRQTYWFTLLGCLLALILAVTVSRRLYCSIVNPISDLTTAFRKLAKGQTLIEIPGLSRHDEIGRMSEAAQVFSEKNRETKELLATAQRLSHDLDEKATSLEEINSELDNFAYVASHDLKAPLRGIKNLATWVREDLGEEIPEETKEHLELMASRVVKMESLLTDLLEYSRIGKNEQQVETIHLRGFVSSVLEMLEDTAEVTISVSGGDFEIETPVPPLRQVLLNLVVNAIKYNDKGTEGRVEIRLEESGDFARVNVIDNGKGIEQTHFDRIFKMYQRVSPGNIEGSGMGLAIVKKQVERLGGTIKLESSVGTGSTFLVDWPKRISSVSGPRTASLLQLPVIDRQSLECSQT
ncbi:sensor histidine kinase [Roseiconus lacunae]|uniref:sensor histidine kinase n=1 Tax=Roseiconus lacunae TaxID=2605694 RepID=UPI0011F0F759|nr:HAMP domain-containing sensor histidine kinase [Roseiconus lacunae]